MTTDTLYNSLSHVTRVSGDTILNEKSDSATLTDVNICDIPNGSLVVKMDTILVNNFFKPLKEWGYNKHSDYMIITDNDILLIEMKSRTSIDEKLTKECDAKFLSDTCILNYADAVFTKILSLSAFFIKKSIHSFLLYQAPPISKTLSPQASFIQKRGQSNFVAIPIANKGTLSYKRLIAL